jgi:uncharacterized protein
MHDANTWIQDLCLTSHPEGGFYREVYRAAEKLDATALPDRFNGKRSISTAIYYLLQAGDFSAFHRIKSDEIWHFYAGGALELIVIYPDGRLGNLRLGNGQSGNRPMHIIPHGSWFAARPLQGIAYSLVGCTVAPGFDFNDFEMAERIQLINDYPQYSDLILSLTRN